MLNNLQPVIDFHYRHPHQSILSFALICSGELQLSVYFRFAGSLSVYSDSKPDQRIEKINQGVPFKHGQDKSIGQKA